MELVFVRHGQSMGNMTGDYSTVAHDALSPEGLRQAERLAERIERWRFDDVCVSPWRRALETAIPFLKRSGMAAEVWPEIAEGCWQDDRFAQPPEVRAVRSELRIPAGCESLFSVRSDALMPYRDETYIEGFLRVAAAARMVRARFRGRPGRVLIVGHGFSGSHLIEMLLGRPSTGRLPHDNTALTRLVEREGSDSFELAEQNSME